MWSPLDFSRQGSLISLTICFVAFLWVLSQGLYYLSYTEHSIQGETAPSLNTAGESLFWPAGCAAAHNVFHPISCWAHFCSHWATDMNTPRSLLAGLFFSETVWKDDTQYSILLPALDITARSRSMIVYLYVLFLLQWSSLSMLLQDMMLYTQNWTFHCLASFPKQTANTEAKSVTVFWKVGTTFIRVSLCCLSMFLIGFLLLLYRSSPGRLGGRSSLLWHGCFVSHLKMAKHPNSTDSNQLVYLKFNGCGWVASEKQKVRKSCPAL